jgi:hypothetical protein
VVPGLARRQRLGDVLEFPPGGLHADDHLDQARRDHQDRADPVPDEHPGGRPAGGRRRRAASGGGTGERFGRQQIDEPIVGDRDGFRQRLGEQRIDDPVEDRRARHASS